MKQVCCYLLTAVSLTFVAGKLSSDAAACKPWRCSTPCGSQQQQQQQRVAASLQGDPHQQHQPTMTGLYSSVSLGSQAPPMSDYAVAAAGVGAGLLDSKPIIAASMF